MAKFILAIMLLAAFAPTCHAGRVLEAVKSSGTLSCGTVSELNDETTDDTHGNLSAFGADMCRAVAAAITDGRGHAKISTYPTEAMAYQALEKGQIALLEGATPRAGLARRYGVTYLTPVFFDGQGFLVHKGRGIASFKDLAQKLVCFIGGTDAELRLHAAVDQAGIKLQYFPFQEIGEMQAALVAGRCDAQTHDISELAAGRAAFHGHRNDFVILPDRLTLDPFAPVVGVGDAEFARAVNWVFYTLVQAQISGVTQASADAMRASPDLFVQTLLGSRRGTQWGLFLQEDWGYQAIKATGNYGEIFDRDLGAHAPQHLDPGPNRPWSEGGMLWAAPMGEN